MAAHGVGEYQVLTAVPGRPDHEPQFHLMASLLVKDIHHKLSGDDPAGLVVLGRCKLIASIFAAQELKLTTDGNSPLIKVNVLPL